MLSTLLVSFKQRKLKNCNTLKETRIRIFLYLIAEGGQIANFGKKPPQVHLIIIRE